MTSSSMQLLLVATAAFASAAAQICPDTPCVAGNSCVYPPGCNANVNINNGEFDYNESPFYDQVITERYDHDQTDSACSTFFPFGPGNVLLWIRYVCYINGSCVPHRYIVSPVDNCLGVYRAQGLRQTTGCDTCVLNDYLLGQPCPNAWVLYRCYTYGDCQQRYSGRDIRFGFSSAEDVPQECKDQMVTLGATENPGLRGSDPLYLPNKNKQCVVSFNNYTCINYERVPCQYRVYL